MCLMHAAAAAAFASAYCCLCMLLHLHLLCLFHGLLPLHTAAAAFVFVHCCCCLCILLPFHEVWPLHGLMPLHTAVADIFACCYCLCMLLLLPLLVWLLLLLLLLLLAAATDALHTAACASCYCLFPCMLSLHVLLPLHDSVTPQTFSNADPVLPSCCHPTAVLLLPSCCHPTVAPLLMSSFARWYWLSSLVSWLSAFCCWVVTTLPNLRASSEVLSSVTFCLFGKYRSAKLSIIVVYVR